MTTAAPLPADGTSSTRVPEAPPERIGILYHPKKPESLVLAEEMAEHLGDCDCSVWTGDAWDEPEALAHVADLDLLITLGGDGTILRAARLGSENGVPVLGVKLGRVSFLAEVPPDQWQVPLDKLLAGEYWIEERMLLDVSVSRAAAPDEDHGYLALNDVVISRGGLARLINVQTWVGDSYLTTYRADGVIVATPTGCTGYALAAGGPILPPELRNILLLPICPHLSLDRPVVLSEGATVSFQVEADHPPILTVDGQFEIALTAGDRVVVKASPHVSRFAHVEDRDYFYRTLMERLRWKV
jgi:NAD+ kinase